MAQEIEIGGGEPFALRLIEEIRADARELVDVPLLSLSVREKVGAMEQIAAAKRALEAAHLSIVRSLQTENLTEVGATSLSALISARLRVPPGRARADVAAARATCPDTGALPRMGAALADGQVSMSHVDVATATIERIPNALREQAAEAIDDTLLGYSRTYRPREVDNLAREILDRLDPDRHDRGYDPNAFLRRGFTLSTDAYGMGLPSGQLDPLSNATLKTALDHFSAPTQGQPDADGRIAFRDERTPAQRRCDALAEIARRALATAGSGGEDATRGGEPPRVVVHATVEDLNDRAAGGALDCEQTGALPRVAFTKVLCDCVLERVLLAPNGAVLNLGRAIRTATAAQKRALAARDRGCIWPGCTIPARWTDAHHVPGWVHGSKTDIDEMCLLCGAHHAMVDLGSYRITMIGGVPHVTPPAFLDPQRISVRNIWWLDKTAARDLGNRLRADPVKAPEAVPPDGPDPPAPK